MDSPTKDAETGCLTRGNAEMIRDLLALFVLALIVAAMTRPYWMRRSPCGHVTGDYCARCHEGMHP